MCLDTGSAIWILLFLLFAAASPFVVIAAVVHVVRNHRTDRLTRLLD